MPRNTTRKTSIRGVEIVSPRLYRVRARFTDPKTGRRRELDRVVPAQSVAAAAALRVDLVRSETKKGAGPDSRARLSTYTESWLKSKLPSLKASTRRTYVERLQHAVDALGDYYVDAITRDDLTKYRDAQVGTAATSTINGRQRVLFGMLRDAVVELQLPIDPTLRLPFLREPLRLEDDEAAGLSLKELRGVLGFMKRKYPQWYPLILTLALCGMRFGEATALKFTDIDFSSGAIRVRRAQWNGVIDSTKTDVKKIVPMPAELARVLRALRDRQRAKKTPGHESGFVFLSGRGTLLFNSVLTKPVRAALKKVGVKRPFRAAHGFRHTFNDLVRRVAGGEVVRALTGHSTEEMTSHYSHVRLDEKHAAVKSIVKMIKLPK